MPSRIKVAQVGVGHFGAYRRARMRETGVFDLVASYDLNPDAMADAEREDGARPTGSYEELLETPGIEAMIISTGGKFHAEQTIAALDRGLHVFVEKPLCSTAAEVEAMAAAQRRTGLVVGVGHTDHRADPEANTVRRLIDDGTIGTVASFDATTSHAGGQMMKPGDWRADPEKNPGGMLFQCGVHKFHELMYLFGPIRRVAAMMRYDVHTTGTADVAVCHIEFESGLVGSVNAYHVCPYYHTLNVFGMKANLYRESRFFDEGTSIAIQHEHLDGASEPREPVAIAGAKDACANVRAFYEAIREDKPMYPSLRDGALAVAVVFAAEESARTGRIVDVPDIGG